PAAVAERSRAACTRAPYCHVRLGTRRYPPGVTAFVVTACGILGLAGGSFLNVVIHRVPKKESVVTPRSRCPQCGTELSARDNIPVVSWLLLRGRCRTCKAPISA